MSKSKFEIGVGINYKGTLYKIKKSEEVLQPLFEAFTNSLESIKLLKKKYNFTEVGCIVIKLCLTTDLYSDETKEYQFSSLEVIDTGIGLEASEYNRLISLNDESKGFSNKGTGRVQYLHSFIKTKIRSVYRDLSSVGKFCEKTIVLSKNASFLVKNAIIKIENIAPSSSTMSQTVLTFEGVIEEKDKRYFEKLTIEEIRNKVLSRYLPYFCENRNDLPLIKIQLFVDNKIEAEVAIAKEDIPAPDNEKSVEILYSKIVGSRIEKSDHSEKLILKSYVISKNALQKNTLNLVSKGEIAKALKLYNITENESIEDMRYLFLLSSRYIDEKDSDDRGDIKILTKSQFLNEKTGKDEVLLEDLEEKANHEISIMYSKIKAKSEEKELRVQKLKEMFLLNEKTVSALKISVNDSDATILEKVYKSDAKISAESDAKLKERMLNVLALDSTVSDYDEKLKNQVDELVKTIPVQNRSDLAHYVARRKLILELFEKTLNRQLEIQASSNRKMDEKLLHNLIFQQSSDNPENSDLWLINEDFLYFSGASENRLKDVKINGELMFKEEVEEEEKKYLNSLGEKRNIKKPDILLFPDESKCIIIELKSPEVNIKDYLHQINIYAGLIRNFTKDELNIDTFYGYLIGEAINPIDVRLAEHSFIEAYHLDYMFRPSTPVPGNIFPNIKKNDGSIYTEIIKYSTLLERAKRRNRKFIEKLGLIINE